MREKLFFLFEDQRCPIMAMHDIDGEPTEEPDEAISIVVMLPDESLMAALVRWPSDIQIAAN
jgi:hypothetical protein